ncbi:tetratricopeptide repeat protein [Mesonia sediminis]|uniref:Tetratricopeptide repeat protein n=1 Tax=Mesonia sediminis TaxID=1703946 RepID=A0ABW5SEZ0_9FLAO
MIINKVYFSFVLLFLFGFVTVQGQERLSEEQKQAQSYLSEAQQAIEEEDFPAAEAAYRKAIAKDPNLAEARYNIGNLYSNNSKPKEASTRFFEAGQKASAKNLKHKAFHNQGNMFMSQKNYAAAVEAYKQALRNNPNDDQTRYNLALAKKMQEKEQQNQDNQDNQDKKDNQDQDNQNNQNNQDQDDSKNKDKPQDEGDKKQDSQQPKDQDQKDESAKPEVGDGQKEPQPSEGKLSPQQIKNLLEAMENQEKEIQDKINAKRVKGKKVQTDKDW